MMPSAGDPETTRANISETLSRRKDGCIGWCCRRDPRWALPIDRLTCWLDTVHVIATRVRVIAIRNPALRMRALLADYRLFGSALILEPSTRILQAPCNGLVLEALVIHRPHCGWWPVSRM